MSRNDVTPASSYPLAGRSTRRSRASADDRPKQARSGTEHLPSRSPRRTSGAARTEAFSGHVGVWAAEGGQNAELTDWLEVGPTAHPATAERPTRVSRLRAIGFMTLFLRAFISSVSSQGARWSGLSGGPRLFRAAR